MYCLLNLGSCRLLHAGPSNSSKAFRGYPPPQGRFPVSIALVLWCHQLSWSPGCRRWWFPCLHPLSPVIFSVPPPTVPAAFSSKVFRPSVYRPPTPISNLWDTYFEPKSEVTPPAHTHTHTYKTTVVTKVSDSEIPKCPIWLEFSFHLSTKGLTFLAI